MTQTQIIVGLGTPLRGRVQVPGDKSISHRALILGALAEGRSHISGFLPSGDCLATLRCVQALGIDVERNDPTTLTVVGRGIRGLQGPGLPLNCARSGTTMRLLSGLLAGQPFESTLTGDAQLLRRPMRRVAAPLREMGAEIEDTDGRAPLVIRAGTLHGCEHILAVPSAQVKSALLLAGLYATGETVVRQPGPARDHTERMLAAMGAAIEIDGLAVTISAATTLAPLALQVPGDFSSAAFLIVAAAVVPGSTITVRGVGVNPTRTGLLRALTSMGAMISLENVCEVGNEPTADLTVSASALHGVNIGGDLVVRMIDEFPALAVAATQARGTTTVRDAAELRVKETDRIACIVGELRKLGAHIEALPDGFVVKGPTPLLGAAVKSHGDHRLAMALNIAGLIADGETVVQDTECISDSFPGFSTTLSSLRQRAPA